ncbi:MAG: glycoside hydrolase family 31 protein [Burkholderiales bacterium]|nr:glycoside hydrolase family 31 protein [Burkholderiales bacterium]
MFLDPSAYLRLEIEGSLGATGTGASFATSTGDMLEVSAYAGGAFRLRLGPNTRPDYDLVVGRARACTTTQPEPGLWRIDNGDAALEISGAPLRLRVLWKNASVLTSTTDMNLRGATRLPTFGRAQRGGLWTAALALQSGESVYGLGGKFGRLDKRGQLIHSQVEDAHGVGTGLASANTPFAWGPGIGDGAWGVFVHTPGMVTHGVGHPDWSHRSYALVVDDEALDLFVFAADTPAAILDAYTALTGRAPAVPRWGLGLWMSRGYFNTPDEAVDVARRLRERRIPCDVLTLDGTSAWRADTRFDFAWDEERFPDPRATLAAIHAQALRVCVWECPYVSVHSRLFSQLAQRGLLLKTAAGDPYVLGVAAVCATGPSADGTTPDSGIFDFTHPEAFAWWRDAHEALFTAGVDAIKSDFGEHVPDDAVAYSGDWGRRLHNVYPLLYNRCAYEATRKFQPAAAGPPMIWSRAGWTGSQRTPIVGSGGAQSDWEGLAASIRGGLSSAMSGSPYHGIDVGGGHGPMRPDAELYVRWLQAAVFCSHVRIHGAGDCEPWSYGAEIEAICRKWLTFRYRLIPYLESVIATAAATGMPVTRAMPLAFPDNVLLRGFETQFMCGDALLVAPVIREGGEVEIALPDGGWFDLNTRQRFSGAQVLRYRARLDRFPVFAREGHALPLGRAVQHTGEIDAAHPLELLWVFGAPTAELTSFAQARIDGTGGASFAIRAAPGVKAELWGDAAQLPVVPL